MVGREQKNARPSPLPRVLVLAASLPSMRALELALGKSVAIRGCLGARAGSRAILTWDPTVIVVEHEPPGLDASEIVRSLARAGRFVPDVLLTSSRASVASLETIAARHTDARVATVRGEGSLALLAHEAHRASERRRTEAGSRHSGTRRRV